MRILAGFSPGVAFPSTRGRSPEMLIRVYAHALPDSLADVARRIGERADRLAE